MRVISLLPSFPIVVTSLLNAGRGFGMAVSSGTGSCPIAYDAWIDSQERLHPDLITQIIRSDRFNWLPVNWLQGKTELSRQSGRYRLKPSVPVPS